MLHIFTVVETEPIPVINYMELNTHTYKGVQAKLGNLDKFGGL